MELIEVIVLVRLPLALAGMLGTGGGGIALSVVSLAILCRMVAPRCRLVVFGLGCVGVTVLLLQAAEARGGSCLAAVVVISKPMTEQMFFASVMEMYT